MKNLLPASIYPSLLAGRLSSTDDSILGKIFRMKVKISPPRRFLMHEMAERTITALTHKNIPSKIEHKRHSVKIELGLCGCAPPRYVSSSVHVRTISKLRSHK